MFDIDFNAGRIGLRFTMILFLIFVVELSTCYALSERLLILPTYYMPGIKNDNTDNWQEIKNIYEQAVLDVEIISDENIIAEWGGDTTRVDIYELGQILDWGNTLEADRIILTEVYNENGQKSYKVYSIDPWEGDIKNSVTGKNLINVIAELENTRWIYGRLISDLNKNFTSPEFIGGDKVLHDYLHTNDLYPPDALIQGISCSVDFEIIVASNGIPLHVKIINIIPEEYEFAPAIEKALWSMHYTPAIFDGKLVTGIIKKQLLISFIK